MSAGRTFYGRNKSDKVRNVEISLSMTLGTENTIINTVQEMDYSALDLNMFRNVVRRLFLPDVGRYVTAT